MSDTRYDFPELRRVLGNRPRLPETPGIYAGFESDESDAPPVFVVHLDDNGFFYKIGRNHDPLTNAEVLSHMGGRPLERLIRASEQDT